MNKKDLGNLIDDVMIGKAIEVITDGKSYCPLCNRRVGGTIPHSEEICTKRVKKVASPIRE